MVTHCFHALRGHYIGVPLLGFSRRMGVSGLGPAGPAALMFFLILETGLTLKVNFLETASHLYGYTLVPCRAGLLYDTLKSSNRVHIVISKRYAISANSAISTP